MRASGSNRVRVRQRGWRRSGIGWSCWVAGDPPWRDTGGDAPFHGCATQGKATCRPRGRSRRRAVGKRSRFRIDNSIAHIGSGCNRLCAAGAGRCRCIVPAWYQRAKAICGDAHSLALHPIYGRIDMSEIGTARKKNGKPRNNEGCRSVHELEPFAFHDAVIVTMAIANQHRVGALTPLNVTAENANNPHPTDMCLDDAEVAFEALTIRRIESCWFDPYNNDGTLLARAGSPAPPQGDPPAWRPQAIRSPLRIIPLTPDGNPLY